jgi:hypothetical protein
VRGKSIVGTCQGCALESALERNRRSAAGPASSSVRLSDRAYAELWAATCEAMALLISTDEVTSAHCTGGWTQGQ